MNQLTDAGLGLLVTIADYELNNCMHYAIEQRQCGLKLEIVMDFERML